MNWHDGLIMI